MSLVPTIDLLHQAQTGGFAIAAFNIVGLEHVEAIVQGAESERAPVILQLSENTVNYHAGAIEPIAYACAELARRSRMPVALHLDHATSEALCTRAVDCGFSSMMLDTDDDKRLKDFSSWAHQLGVAVELAVGVVGGKEGTRSTAAGMTDPEVAQAVVTDIKPDALAIAVGTTHAMEARTAKIEVDLIARIRRRVDVPLVLHGASGVPDRDLQAAIAAGITKVNLATQLNIAFTGAVRRALSKSNSSDPRPYLAAGRTAMEHVVRERLRLLGSCGRA